jgi:hypothetical protein
MGDAWIDDLERGPLQGIAANCLDINASLAIQASA